MNALTILLIVFLFVNCSEDKTTGVDIPVEPVNKVNNIDKKDVSVEVDLKYLKFEVDNIKDDKVLENLSYEEKIEFNRNLHKLRKNLNKTISLIREDYTRNQKEKLVTSYKRTKVIWDYLVTNYQI